MLQEPDLHAGPAARLTSALRQALAGDLREGGEWVGVLNPLLLSPPGPHWLSVPLLKATAPISLPSLLIYPLQVPASTTPLASLGLEPKQLSSVATATVPVPSRFT